jgi:polysaccharide deacetylase 2 family uncharacterized protein YibQ
MDDAFNMSMRKFLKQVGVTSQQQIEEAVREQKPSGTLRARVVLTIDELGLTHTVEGDIKTGEPG